MNRNVGLMMAMVFVLMGGASAIAAQGESSGPAQTTPGSAVISVQKVSTVLNGQYRVESMIYVTEDSFGGDENTVAVRTRKTGLSGENTFAGTWFQWGGQQPSPLPGRSPGGRLTLHLWPEVHGLRSAAGSAPGVGYTCRVPGDAAAGEPVVVGCRDEK